MKSEKSSRAVRELRWTLRDQWSEAMRRLQGRTIIIAGEAFSQTLVLAIVCAILVQCCTDAYAISGERMKLEPASYEVDQNGDWGGEEGIAHQ